MHSSPKRQIKGAHGCDLTVFFVRKNATKGSPFIRDLYLILVDLDMVSADQLQQGTWYIIPGVADGAAVQFISMEITPGEGEHTDRVFVATLEDCDGVRMTADVTGKEIEPGLMFPCQIL